MWEFLQVSWSALKYLFCFWFGVFFVLFTIKMNKNLICNNVTFCTCETVFFLYYVYIQNENKPVIWYLDCWLAIWKNTVKKKICINEYCCRNRETSIRDIGPSTYILKSTAQFILKKQKWKAYEFRVCQVPRIGDDARRTNFCDWYTEICQNNGNFWNNNNDQMEIWLPTTTFSKDAIHILGQNKIYISSKLLLFIIIRYQLIRITGSSMMVLHSITTYL